MKMCNTYHASSHALTLSIGSWNEFFSIECTFFNIYYFLGVEA